ncbi:condensation domain-containing protein, partial [Rhodococcus sp. GXMU-t2271]
PERSTARHPLFQVGLSFQNLATTSLELPGLTVSGVDADLQTSQFDLHLVVTDRYADDGAPEGITSVLTYATDLFDEPTVVGFAERFVRVLEAVVADPSVALGDIE